MFACVCALVGRGRLLLCFELAGTGLYWIVLVVDIQFCIMVVVGGGGPVVREWDEGDCGSEGGNSSVLIAVLEILFGRERQEKNTSAWFYDA